MMAWGKQKGKGGDYAELCRDEGARQWALDELNTTAKEGKLKVGCWQLVRLSV